jgi:hypothetical protein
MTIENKIAELKELYPTLSKGINDQIIEMDADEYNATISEWAQNFINQENEKAEIEAAKIAAQAKLAALGLTTDDLKALGL